MTIPIACSLTASQLDKRVEEWRAFLESSVTEATRDGDTLRLRLVPADQAVLEAVDLSAREKACCAFFSFALDIDVESRTLCITVPSEARPVLDDFAGLLPVSLRP